MIRPTALALAVALALLAGQPAQAQTQELQALDGLQTLALQDSGRALRALRAQATAFEASPSVEVQRTYLSLLVGLASDTGQTAQADEAARRLMALAQERRDDVALVLATGSVAHRMAANGDTGGALEKLRQMAPVALRSGSAEALWVYHLMLGGLQNSTGQFEPALANILQSMDHARARPDGRGLSRAAGPRSDAGRLSRSGANPALFAPVADGDRARGSDRRRRPAAAGRRALYVQPARLYAPS